MPETLLLHAEDPHDMERAAKILRRGGLVAFPTETVYGLGADATSADAVASIFAAKGRPGWDPLIVHLADAAQIGTVTLPLRGEIGERVRRLAEAFWPGPLTLLLPRFGGVPDAVTAGRRLVGVRVPGHPVAQQLLRAAGVPIAAPSANRFGHVSPTTAHHVLDDLQGRIEAIVDGGQTAIGVESTVLDPTSTPMVLYRAGAVSAEQIEAATGAPVTVYEPQTAAIQEPREALPSPGVGIRHYAPEVPVLLTEGAEPELHAAIATLHRDGRERIGVLLPRGWQRPEGVSAVVAWGKWADGRSLAAGLFAGLRALEGAGIDRIVCPLPEVGELREAVRDRLQKAARPR